MRSIVGRFVLGVAVMLAATMPSYGAGVCGNGVPEAGEECDPGGQLYIDGDPGTSGNPGTPCTNGSDCFYELSCCKFNCQFVGQGAPCADGNECTTNDKCDNVGRCLGFFKADGATCDDGVFCNGADTCQTGECDGHAGDPCTGNTDCQTSCNEGNESCDSTPNVPCGDDGNTCTDDVCDGSGTCTHPALSAGTVCRPLASVCDVAEQCAGGGAPCPADGFVPDNTACGDLCTSNGSCQGGVCTLGDPLDCDDDDVCNGLESCNGLTGCVPGTPLDCTDGSSCTEDLCDSLTGCSNPGLPDDSPCDDENLCTIIDRCQAGVCEGEELAFLARTSAKVGRTSILTARLGVNDVGGTAKIGNFCTASDGTLISADNVILGKLAEVDDVEANTLRAGRATINGTSSPATLPLVPDSAFCAMPSGACGGSDVFVSGVQRLMPGTYGNLIIVGRATAELDTGEYEFCSLRAGASTAIRARGNVDIRVRGSLKMGRLATIEPFAGSTRIWVNGTAKISTSALVSQTAIYAPNSFLKLGRLSDYSGAFCGNSLRTNRSVQLGCPSTP